MKQIYVNKNNGKQNKKRKVCEQTAHMPPMNDFILNLNLEHKKL